MQLLDRQAPMTRAYAAHRLLALGPLTFREFHAITGWPVRACYRTLEHLLLTERARFIGRGWKRRYEAAQ